jgi:Domain of unknown function (DUF4115)
MARLRVRVEMNRGGVGIPLHKLSSVVQEAGTFFQMLAEDVRIEKNRGEWLAFDFDNESLNFTAEYVGPASVEQVQAFAAAFDGTTSLRRATIAQFTRITDAIGEDELIGFGLYHADHETEPSEWRCLSRRDALRIADEMQVLLGASGELDQAKLNQADLDQTTHLPAVIDPSMGARLFKERHDRGALAAEQSKWPVLVREVEANLSKRIARLEGEVEDHSHSIHELRDTSGAAEESFRNLLSSVETFCAQATRQLEKITPTAQLPAPAPVPLPKVSSGRGWRRYTIAAILIIGVVSAVVLWWSPKSGEPVESKVAAASVAPPPEVSRKSSPPAAVPAPKTKVSNPGVIQVGALQVGVMHVDIEARQAAWVAITDASGKRLIAKTFEANETRSLDLPGGATLRTGNAGGLVVRFNGKEIGPLGPTGKIRDISFKNGAYKIHAPDAG